MPAKLFFYYSTMNAGKSSTLLQANHNYQERGLRTLLFIPKITGKQCISSRIGLSAPAIQFAQDFNFLPCLEKAVEESRFLQSAFLESMKHDMVVPCEGVKHDLACVLVDEAQFLTKAQVIQLTKVADELDIPVLCYGLRSDFLGEPFEGSKYLLTHADVMTEIKSICFCGRKASNNQRIRSDGTPLAAGEQIQVGGNERYVGKCRRHFHEGLAQAALIEKASEAKENEPPTKQRRVTEATPEKKDQEPALADDVSSTSPSSA